MLARLASRTRSERAMPRTRDRSERVAGDRRSVDTPPIDDAARGALGTATRVTGTARQQKPIRQRTRVALWVTSSLERVSSRDKDFTQSRGQGEIKSRTFAVSKKRCAN